MSDLKHLEIINEGIQQKVRERYDVTPWPGMEQDDMELWNKMRAQNPDVDPDLSNADLFGADLRGANLSNVDLSRANLSKADLSRANLLGANMTEANLAGANLSEADPCYSCLLEANLSKADLTRANLTGANLTEANLSGANLTGTDLTRVIGLSESEINKAWGDKCTLLPADLQRPEFWEW